MKWIFIFLLFPLTALSQNTDTAKLTNRLDSEMVFMAKSWKYKVGDNPAWATPGYDDSSWQRLPVSANLYSVKGLPVNNGTVWFRRTISTDTALTKQLVLRIFQSGASEVYLDGRLIHKLGTIGSSAAPSVYYNPGVKLLAFPLQYNTPQVLAVRFYNMPAQFPLYPANPKSFLSIYVSTLDRASEDATQLITAQFVNGLYAAIGVSLILGVMYLSFFLFFTSQKVNLYFSLCNFSFTAYLIIQATFYYSHLPLFAASVASVVMLALYSLLFLHCIYTIFNYKKGWAFKIIQLAAVAIIAGVFLLDADILVMLMGIIMLGNTLWVSVRSLKKNKVAARIIILASATLLAYIVWLLLATLGVIPDPWNINIYAPLGFLLNPLGLAIYLGYAFGDTSAQLRQKLTEVQQLSSEKQAILQTQNETLEQQVQQRTQALNQSLESLKATQTQLVHAEKMASLGELTAGIAHEIQNPLNFVNNFSEVSNELMDEMTEELARGDIDEAKIIAGDIKQNLQKINHHGKRAEFIVKGMLEHSRTSTGERQPTNINILADEFLKLSYHGLRAKDKNFNATLVTNFDAALPKVNVAQQDIGRVLLNLFNNAFYAVSKQSKAGLPGYQPTVEVSTFAKNGFIYIVVKDNGNGIPAAIKDKIMQPFFTTKPTGEGTGLGLSLSYDIVVKGHGGTIEVNSTEGQGAEFVVRLPV